MWALAALPGHLQVTWASLGYPVQIEILRDRVVSRCYLAALPGHLAALPGHLAALPGHLTALPGYPAALPGPYADLTYVAFGPDLQVAWEPPGFGGYP